MFDKLMCWRFYILSLVLKNYSIIDLLKTVADSTSGCCEYDDSCWRDERWFSSGGPSSNADDQFHFANLVGRSFLDR
jgi:hypothetical protein